MTEESPTIMAHTGCDGTAENTVESAMTGHSFGADLVEVDVRADPDGIAVHAAVLDRRGWPR